MTREEWLVERRKGIGASDAAAVLGLNPYMGPVAVYNDKIGIGSEVVETEAMKWGRKLEPFVADAFMDRHPEYRLVTPPEYHMVWHPQLKFIFCTPDRFLDPINGAPAAGLQLKTVGGYAIRHWPEDNMPDRYLVQCIHENACNPERSVWFLDALVGGQAEREYRIERDLALEHEILRRLSAFWEDHVIARVPPPLDSTPASDRLLKHLYPAAGQFVRQATAREAALLDEFRELRIRYSGVEEAYDAIENRVKELIGTDKGLDWIGGRVLWGSVSGRRRTNWKAVADALNAPAEVVEAHTEVSAPLRRFTVKLNEDESNG